MEGPVIYYDQRKCVLEKNPGGHAKLRRCIAKEKTICSQGSVNKGYAVQDQKKEIRNLRNWGGVKEYT